MDLSCRKYENWLEKPQEAAARETLKQADITVDVNDAACGGVSKKSYTTTSLPFDEDDLDGVFNHAYFFQAALSCLKSQLKAEEAKYFVKNNGPTGYLPRYTFSDNIHEVFDKASKMCFSTNARAPVGLNPERFVVACMNCSKWLINSEFGVEYCELCQEEAAAAAAENN